MSLKDAYRKLIAPEDAPNPFGFTEEEQMALGIHESQRTGQGYKYNPTTGTMELYNYDTDTFVEYTGEGFFPQPHTTTTDPTDSNAAFNTFISPFYNSELTPAQLKYCANDVIYLHRIHDELKKILEREKRIELYNDCLKFLNTRVELDLALFKDDIWAH